MQDALETLIRTRKDELDVFEADDRLWQRIDQTLSKDIQTSRRRNLWTQSWKVAASVLLIIGIGGLWFWLSGPYDRGDVSLDPQRAYTAELAEVEQFYSQMISDRQSQIESYRKEGVILDEALQDQTNQLAEAYYELQHELLRTEDQDLIVNAMIQNLMTQMEILNQQLQILEHIKQLRYGNQAHS